MGKRIEYLYSRIHKCVTCEGQLNWWYGLCTK